MSRIDRDAGMFVDQHRLGEAGEVEHLGDRRAVAGVMRGGAPAAAAGVAAEAERQAAGHAKLAMAAKGGEAGDDVSPTFTVRTSLPTASTMPAASWPGMQGRGCG